MATASPAALFVTVWDTENSGETDDELVRTTVRLRKWVREKVAHMKVDTGKNVEDIVDEALRDYIDRQ